MQDTFQLSKNTLHTIFILIFLFTARLLTPCVPIWIDALLKTIFLFTQLKASAVITSISSTFYGSVLAINWFVFVTLARSVMFLNYFVV